MDYDKRNPSRVAQALLGGERAIYEHKDGTLHGLHVYESGVKMLDGSCHTSSQNVQTYFFGMCGYTRTKLSELVGITKNRKAQERAKKDGPKKPDFYEQKNTRTREFAEFIRTIHSDDDIISGGIVMYEVWREMVRRRPGLLDRYTGIREMKSDFNDVRNGLKISEKKEK